MDLAVNPLGPVGNVSISSPTSSEKAELKPISSFHKKSLHAKHIVWKALSEFGGLSDTVSSTPPPPLPPSALLVSWIPLPLDLHASPSVIREVSSFLRANGSPNLEKPNSSLHALKQSSLLFKPPVASPDAASPCPPLPAVLWAQPEKGPQCCIEVRPCLHPQRLTESLIIQSYSFDLNFSGSPASAPPRNVPEMQTLRPYPRSTRSETGSRGWQSVLIRSFDACWNWRISAFTSRV